MLFVRVLYLVSVCLCVCVSVCVCAYDGADLALEVGGVCVLVLLVSHSKEHWGGEVATVLGEAETEDSVDTVEICDSLKKGAL